VILEAEVAMSRWWDIRDPDNRAMLGWLGAGVAAVIGAVWVAFLHFDSPESGDGGGSIKVEASCGNAAAQGNMVGSSVTAGGASSTADCPPKRE
jgi:hypothetical protein